MSDLQYRPNHYDDWGMIRNADGSMHASVHRPETYLGEFDEHREADTDPFADLARKIIFFDDLEAENVSLRQLLSEAETREREARAKALEEAAKVAEAEYKRHCTGSGFDSQPARSTAHRILEALKALQSEER